MYDIIENKIYDREVKHLPCNILILSPELEFHLRYEVKDMLLEEEVITELTTFLGLQVIIVEGYENICLVG